MVQKATNFLIKRFGFNELGLNPSRLLILIVLFLSTFSAFAQTTLTQSFRFSSGVYLSFEAFKSNVPSYGANDIEGNYFINQQTKQAKVEYIRLKATQEKLDLDEMWCIVIKGIPYVKTTPNLPPHSLKVFAAMEVRGNICYFAYDDIEEKEMTFKAYNPLIGKPFRTGKVKRKVPVIKEKMLRFRTGEIAPFNYSNLLQWLADDAEIVTALKSLGPEKAESKLFDALLLYNDKYLVSLD
ncbi:MAG: hypothetical protein AAF960_02165 [Bacteroidota bacterium]